MKKFVTHILASFAINLFYFRLSKLEGATPRSSYEWGDWGHEKELKQKRLLKAKPFVYQKIRKRYRSPLHYQSTKSRNVRDLDQRKIRRKHTNY